MSYNAKRVIGFIKLSGTDDLDYWLKDEGFFEGYWEVMKVYPEMGVLL